MTPKCYYELLGIEKTASDSDIKKAYRLKALQCHPDKNPDNIDEMTEIFAQIQSAYQVLSDPKERAWYDRHREEILYGSQSAQEVNVMPYFSTTAYSGYDDSKKGFYTVYRNLFEQLERLEMQESEERFNETYFGNANSSFVPLLKEFYERWSGFSTRRSFMHLDKYRLSDAPNRQVRRLMEKENKKIREIAKREYSETIRNLVDFVRKRDPRYQEYMKQKEIEENEKKERQKERLEQQKQKEREIIFEEQDWAKVDEEEYFLTAEEEDEDVFECVVCDKEFRTLKQLKNHESSKKHLKQLNELKKMMEEDDLMYFDKEQADVESVESKADIVENDLSHRGSQIDEIEPMDTFHQEEKLEDQEEVDNSPLQSEEKANSCEDENLIRNLSESIENIKINKKQKKKKKKNENTCKTCKESFQTRNALFNHLREKGHAAFK